MYELIQHLIAFKYACKVKHWSTDNYSKHLLFDLVDLSEHYAGLELPESYFGGLLSLNAYEGVFG